MVLGRKYPTVDIMKLYSQGDSEVWNHWLTKCYNAQDIFDLVKKYYGIQAGMADVAKLKLNDDKFDNWFMRLMRSIEITLRKIYNEKNPVDLALITRSLFKDKPKYRDKFKQGYVDKKKRDEQFELFLRGISF